VPETDTPNDADALVVGSSMTQGGRNSRQCGSVHLASTGDDAAGYPAHLAGLRPGHDRTIVSGLGPPALAGGQKPRFQQRRNPL
jgi:hypothetical protein